MLHSVMKWLRRLIGPPPREPRPATIALPDRSGSSIGGQMAIFTDEHTETIAPYDENLLERAKTQWQFGDWQSLAAIDHNSLEHHPERAKLALLAAAGHAQLGNTATARQFIGLAEDWGCNKRLIAQILIAGVHNSLGRAAVINGQNEKAVEHFKKSIVIGAPGRDSSLLSKARLIHQYQNPDLIKELNKSNYDRKECKKDHI